MATAWEDLPRVRLAHLPTPLEEARNLSRELGGPRVLIKRDDCTGLATGGNKTRKLEFLVGDALARGSDVLLTEGNAQSNHCRQTAAAAAAHGLECVLVLSPARCREMTGNLLLDYLLGAKVVTVASGAERMPRMRALAEELASQGRRPYVIPTGGSNGIGAVGYAVALHELLEQEPKVDAIVFCSGSGGTHGGLIAGARLAGYRGRIIGISDGEPRADLVERVRAVAAECLERLGRPGEVQASAIEVLDDYAREGYGVPNQKMIDAIRLVARTQGVVLDPVYSGKAMAGLIDLTRRGEFRRGQTVAFIHTGGIPALFAYREELGPDRVRQER